MHLDLHKHVDLKGFGAAMPQKVQPMSRGAEREELRFAQSRPAQHAENQYEGFFKGSWALSLNLSRKLAKTHVLGCILEWHLLNPFDIPEFGDG